MQQLSELGKDVGTPKLLFDKYRLSIRLHTKIIDAVVVVVLRNTVVVVGEVVIVVVVIGKVMVVDEEVVVFGEVAVENVVVVVYTIAVVEIEFWLILISLPDISNNLFIFESNF